MPAVLLFADLKDRPEPFRVRLKVGSQGIEVSFAAFPFHFLDECAKFLELFSIGLSWR